MAFSWKIHHQIICIRINKINISPFLVWRKCEKKSKPKFSWNLRNFKRFKHRKREICCPIYPVITDHVHTHKKKKKLMKRNICSEIISFILLNNHFVGFRQQIFVHFCVICKIYAPFENLRCINQSRPLHKMCIHIECNSQRFIKCGIARVFSMWCRRSSFARNSIIVYIHICIIYEVCYEIHLN